MNASPSPGTPFLCEAVKRVFESSGVNAIYGHFDIALFMERNQCLKVEIMPLC